MKDVWHAFECFACVKQGTSGLVFDVRVPENEPMASATCPRCGNSCELRLTWTADENGYGSRGTHKHLEPWIETTRREVKRMPPLHKVDTLALWLNEGLEYDERTLPHSTILFSAAQRLDAFAERCGALAKLARAEEADLLRLDSAHCRYVTPHGTDGYLCCRQTRGHQLPHRTVYTEPNDSRDAEWLTLEAWQDKYGAAARAAYGKTPP